MTCDQGLHTAVRTTGLGECAVLPPLQSVQSGHHAPSAVHHTYGTNEKNAFNNYHYFCSNPLQCVLMLTMSTLQHQNIDVTSNYTYKKSSGSLFTCTCCYDKIDIKTSIAFCLYCGCEGLCKCPNSRFSY